MPRDALPEKAGAHGTAVNLFTKRKNEKLEDKKTPEIKRAKVKFS